MRELATIRRIDAINPIPGADAIEVATVGGWKTVVKKGEYAVGDLAIYFEVDSWMPTELAPFLTKGKEPREFNGVKGERLRTVKLRGQLSQGLLLPVNVGIGGFHFIKDTAGETVLVNEGDNVTDALGIQKWEKPIPAQLAGLMKGNFPTQIPKTDQERIQNLKAELQAAIDAGLWFEETEKLEGSSMTVYLIDGEFGVCSRNIDLKETEDNAFWRRARLDQLEYKMRGAGLNNIAFQGELIGPGIQENIYGLADTEFHVFDIYDIETGDFLKPLDRRDMAMYMGLNHAPVINEAMQLLPMEQMLARVETRTVLPGNTTNTLAEGRVYKQVNGGMTFKVISNSYLLGEK